MKRISYFLVIAAVLALSGCSSSSSLETKRKDLVIKRSFVVANAYIDSCKTHNQTLLAINLGLLPASLPDNPELQILRIKIDSSIVNIRNYLMSVDRYRNFKETNEQTGIVSRESARAERFILDSISRASEEYAVLREESLSLIKENNLRIITLIVEDYEKRGEEIPLNWIPNRIRVQIMQTAGILKINKKIDKVDNEILKKYGNKKGIVT